ncbi:MAG: indolepyruvate oxidoreductase subunit beta [Deltaproteobacteria bacterium]|nr:indolepyruvate oxidoreductase subunit beta [Deltaproteobacteria bacterium]
MKVKPTNVVIAGVGGQGNVLMSDLLAARCALEGFDVKKTDILGLAVRGGNVFSHVRWGERISSPVIGRAKADYLLSLEWLEAARQRPYLKKGGQVLINDARIYPMLVSTGQAEYPESEEIIESFSGWASKVTVAPALSLAQQLGNTKVANTILLGILARDLGFDFGGWSQVLTKGLPANILDINLKAFEIGYAFEDDSDEANIEKIAIQGGDKNA